MKDGASNDRGPIYRRVVDHICLKIRSGEWPAGYKLPTVRELAGQQNISCGTVKHAYDELELLGMIEMTQGRGTFVKDDAEKGSQSRKEAAMSAIDEMIAELGKLGFSGREIRIFLDLKLRERDEFYQNVRVGVVDCNPEALSIIDSQMAQLPHIDIYKFLLDDVLADPYRLDDNLDLILTTSTHLKDVEKLSIAGNKLMFVALSPSQTTVMDLAKVNSAAKTGILCASRKFAEIIRDSCDRFCVLAEPPETRLLGEREETESFAAACDVLIVPKGYLQFCGKEEGRALSVFSGRGKLLIPFDYHIDKGSFFYLKERIEQIHRTRQQK